MIGVRLYLAQRLSAMVMVPLVFGHLAIMIYAIRDGLSAAEILSRTQGSIFWGLFYGLFVIAAAIHASIGLRVLAHEYLKIGNTNLNLLTGLIGSGFLILGARAVIAVTL
ncbi:MAG: succinate dehydrogenase [Hyphomicrobiales bacterium]|nr:succinate dehydrogenase [Hyphomicrobiales bacterium]